MASQLSRQVCLLFLDVTAVSLLIYFGESMKDVKQRGCEHRKQGMVLTHLRGEEQAVVPPIERDA